VFFLLGNGAIRDYNAGMIVRKTQITAFQDHIERDFAREIRRDLETHHPDLLVGIPPAQLDLMVRSGMRRARSHGLARKYSIALFVELMFLVAPNFDEYPPVATLLKDRSIGPDARFDAVVATTSEQQWQGARKRSNPAAWNMNAGPEARS
jgi:hypothetical protein